MFRVHNKKTKNRQKYEKRTFFKKFVRLRELFCGSCRLRSIKERTPICFFYVVGSMNLPGGSPLHLPEILPPGSKTPTKRPLAKNQWAFCYAFFCMRMCGIPSSSYILPVGV